MHTQYTYTYTYTHKQTHTDTDTYKLTSIIYTYNLLINRTTHTKHTRTHKQTYTHPDMPYFHDSYMNWDYDLGFSALHTFI